MPNTNLVPNNACVYVGKNRIYPGIAIGCFAGSMFRTTSGNEYINEVTGTSFLWYDFADDCEYNDNKFNIRRPTLEEWQTLFTASQRNTVLENAGLLASSCS